MVDFSFHFKIELTAEQIEKVKYIKHVAEMDKGSVIAFLTEENEIEGYVVPKHKVNYLNKVLDAKAKDSKIKLPKFNDLVSQKGLLK